ncbi:HTH_Tnp_Tc3_2 domain-containing protein [Trichonephila clavipes]|nr:HTH_Tnp_Tc3_2 domain-containing protein [Trichonephila clavipes]
MDLTPSGLEEMQWTRADSLSDVSTFLFERTKVRTQPLLVWVRDLRTRLECGRPQLEVSEELGIAQSVISRLWERFQDDDNVNRCYSTGHPRVTTPNEDRYLAFIAKRNRRSTASDLSRQLSSAIGTTVSRQTVYRRLGHIGLYAQMCSTYRNSLSPAINLE